MGGTNWKRPTAIKGTLNHAKTSFCTEICAGAIISLVGSVFGAATVHNFTRQYWNFKLLHGGLASLAHIFKIHLPQDHFL
jgi:hypothetical protein